MKNILLFCLLVSAYIISPKNVSAQYKSVFGDSSTSWSYANCIATMDHAVITDSVYVLNDTLFKGQYYKVLLCYNTYYRDKEHYGFLREDTTSGKVWFKKELEDTIEVLSMDMTLKVGDSLEIMIGSLKLL